MPDEDDDKDARRYSRPTLSWTSLILGLAVWSLILPGLVLAYFFPQSPLMNSIIAYIIVMVVVGSAWGFICAATGYFTEKAGRSMAIVGTALTRVPLCLTLIFLLIVLSDPFI